jgi:hypothetical protein
MSVGNVIGLFSFFSFFGINAIGCVLFLFVAGARIIS